MIKFVTNENFENDVVQLSARLEVNRNGILDLILENKEGYMSYVVSITPDGYLRRHSGVAGDYGEISDLQGDVLGYILMENE